MENGVENHPQRKQIIDALLNGEPVRELAKRVKPPLHYLVLWRYKKKHITPALERATKSAEVLQTVADVREVMHKRIDEQERAKDETRAALADHPILARVEAKYKRYDRWMTGAEDKADWRACASIDGAETKALELHARLSGLLDGPQAQSHSIVVIMPQSAIPAGPAPRQIEPADVVDCQVVERPDV